MKTPQLLLFVVVSALVLASNAGAQAPATTCTAVAQEKKLAGAAKTSFLKKCEREATEKCEAAATERKLAGAAKKSSVQKCAREAVGI